MYMYFSSKTRPANTDCERGIARARRALSSPGGGRALSLPLRRALGKCVCGAQSARPLHGPTRAPIGAERARQSGLGSLGTCPGACQDVCRGPAAGGENEWKPPETTARPGGICSEVTGDGWVCVEIPTISYHWRSGTLLGPSRALAQRCAAGCASGVTAHLSVVGRRSCRWRPGAAAASRAYSSPARAPAVNKRSREGDARTRPLNEARPSHRLDEARLASRVDSARQKPREAWEYLARVDEICHARES